MQLVIKQKGIACFTRFRDAGVCRSGTNGALGRSSRDQSELAAAGARLARIIGLIKQPRASSADLVAVHSSPGAPRTPSTRSNQSDVQIFPPSPFSSSSVLLAPAFPPVLSSLANVRSARSTRLTTHERSARRTWDLGTH